MIISDPNSFEDYGNPRILKRSGTVVKADLTKRACTLVEVLTLSN